MDGDEHLTAYQLVLISNLCSANSLYSSVPVSVCAWTHSPLRDRESQKVCLCACVFVLVKDSSPAVCDSLQ